MPPEGNSSFTQHHEVAELSTSTVQPLCFSAKKSLSFASFIKVRETLHLNEYSDEERQAVWYTEKEFRTMEEERFESIQAIEEHIFVEDDQNTARGLETSKERLAREEIAFVTVDCVLDEQHFQLEEGYDDPLYIAGIYKYYCFSHHCARTAHRKALEDHAECFDTYEELSNGDCG